MTEKPFPASSELRQAGKFAGDWLFELVQRAQPLLCDPVHANVDSVEALFAKLPQPSDRFAQLALHGVLLEILVAHASKHDLTGPDGCREYVRCALMSCAIERQPHNRAVLAIATAIETNCSTSVGNILTQFRRHSSVSGSGYTADDSNLRRQFKRAYGISMKQYQTRIRVREAIRLFVEGNRKTCSVSRMVGYASETNLYNAFRKLTHHTPGELQDLPDAVLRDLMAHLTPLALDGDVGAGA